MRKLHAEGMGVRKIGSLLSRSSDTVSKHVFQKHIKKKPTMFHNVEINANL